MVVIDSPPALAFADAEVLAAHADATMLVVDVTQSRERQLTEAADALRRVNAHVVGVVLNRMKQQRSDDAYYYHYSTDRTASAAVGPSDTAYRQAVSRPLAPRTSATPKA